MREPHDVLQRRPDDRSCPAVPSRRRAGRGAPQRLGELLLGLGVGAGLAELLQDRVHQVVVVLRGEIPAELELDLAETESLFRPVRHRHQVVVDFPQIGPFGVSQHDPAPEGLEDDDAAQHGAADDPAQNPRRLRRHLLPDAAPGQFHAVDRAASVPSSGSFIVHLPDSRSSPSRWRSVRPRCQSRRSGVSK